VKIESAESNPPGNSLGSGVSGEQVSEAIRRSGYPLQTIIANSLRDRFDVEEEWSFIDDDSRERRTLDIHAFRRLYDRKKDRHTRVRPVLNFLIECKQSDMPYVFFLSPEKWRLSRFPFFAGLFNNDEIQMSTGGTRSKYIEPIGEVLGLFVEPFMTHALGQSMFLSKCVRKGKGIEISGSEPYQSLILPMVKAVKYFEQHVRPPSTAAYFDLHLALAIAVIDGPMIAADISDQGSQLTFVPWVRAVRNEANEEGDHMHVRSHGYAIDIVHKQYFPTYLEEHVMPFATQFCERALLHAEVLAAGKGYSDNWAKRVHGVKGCAFEPNIRLRRGIV
jgi:hypothetical protein